MLAPFPWFGGKSWVADLVWSRLGDTPNYVETFAGSLGVMLARPAWDTAAGNWVDDMNRVETVNDADCFLANFWRATQADPATVARWCDWPVNEADLHARHSWLMARRTAFGERMMGDPDYYDAKIAGWWVWGICQWIGSGWCSGQGPWQSVDGRLVNVKQGNAGRGINRKLPHVGDAGMGINRKRPHVGNAGRGINRKRQAEEWTEHTLAIMQQLSDRLRRVRVCCGDWSRVCGPTPTVKNGLTAVFLDPPYSGDAGRQADLYAEDSDDVAHAVRRWAIAHGNNPLLHIALCGYDGEHAMPENWTAVSWTAHGGFGSQGNGRGRANREREVIWFSPHCLNPTVFEWTLFAAGMEA